MPTPLNTLEALRLGRRRVIVSLGILTAALLIGSCGSSSSGVTVTAPALSSDASLSALLISSGTLTPAFTPATTSYSASVSNGTPFVMLTPATAHSGARVTVNGTTVASGTASGGVSLSVGTNAIAVLVTAQDGVTTRAYTVVVTRASVVAARTICACLQHSTSAVHTP